MPTLETPHGSTASLQSGPGSHDGISRGRDHRVLQCAEQWVAGISWDTHGGLRRLLIPSQAVQRAPRSHISPYFPTRTSVPDLSIFRDGRGPDHYAERGHDGDRNRGQVPRRRETHRRPSHGLRPTRPRGRHRRRIGREADDIHRGSEGLPERGLLEFRHLLVHHYLESSRAHSSVFRLSGSGLDITSMRRPDTNSPRHGSRGSVRSRRWGPSGERSASEDVALQRSPRLPANSWSRR